MGRAYYNEHDRKAAAWLRELIAAGHLPAGDVDERDIQLVQPADLAGYEQCHFFAGIGGWPYALRLAGWDGPVWTGSCPCQPFSDAGKKAGIEDSRHLWPAWFRLIRECRPAIVFGEQVASRDGLAWFDHVSSDLEAEGYAVGAADLCAAGSGAPHIRQRLFFVAHAEHAERGTHAIGPRLDGCDGQDSGREEAHGEPGARSQVRGLADADRGEWGSARGHADTGTDWRDDAGRGSESHPWADLIWLPCRDGKHRPAPAQPALFPLAPRLPGRVGLLRGAGNAIVPAVAAQFIRAFREVIE